MGNIHRIVVIDEGGFETRPYRTGTKTGPQPRSARNPNTGANPAIVQNWRRVRPQPGPARDQMRTQTIDPAIDLNRPPFQVVPALGPRRVALEMVRCFRKLSTLPRPVSRTFALAQQSIGLEPADPLVRAGRSIAADIDAGIGAGDPAGYHHARHFRDVMLCTLYLARLAGVPPRSMALLVLAALVHDFHHDGRDDGSQPFRLETLALARTRPYLRQAGVAQAEQALLGAFVLATNAACGWPFARACHLAHGAGQTLPPPPERAPGLQPLREQPDWAMQAVLLGEADVLPSLALTLAYARRMQASLGLEWGRTLGPEDQLHFIDQVFGRFYVGGFFSPNLQAIRQAFVRRLGGI